MVQPEHKTAKKQSRGRSKPRCAQSYDWTPVGEMRTTREDEVNICKISQCRCKFCLRDAADTASPFHAPASTMHILFVLARSWFCTVRFNHQPEWGEDPVVGVYTAMMLVPEVLEQLTQGGRSRRGSMWLGSENPETYSSAEI